MEGLEKVVGYLRERGIEVKTLVSDQSTHDSTSASKVFGIKLSQIAKAIVFDAVGKAILVLISGDRNVNVNRLREVVGVKKVKLAKPEFVLSNTGFVVGAVPPVAHSKPVKIYVDKSLFRNQIVYPAGGTTNSLFEIELEKLLNFINGEIVDIGQPMKSGV
ncbi:TPA: YbaK/EbsC family protein [Candidatus Poribacteria bacterium]|nr:YbaK/EbsC family protein [Candidatus Poribacteria bacterium]